MATPSVPGQADDVLELACGEEVRTHDLDLGMREYECACGDRHAIVMDVHPLTRFVPEFLADTLRSTISTDDEFDEFTTAHVMAMVKEEFPEAVSSADCSGDGHVGFGLVWISAYDARRLHVVVVELLVELMDHAISHTSDELAAEFEEYLTDFDVDEFVDIYRAERNFEDEFDTPV